MDTIYEGAAGLGRLGRALSSYEAVRGFGDYFETSNKLRGFGAFGVSPSDCPPITSTFMPPGIVSHDSQGRQICDKADANAALCNTTADPYSCYLARQSNSNFKNRLSAADMAGWRAWAPAGAGAPILGDYRKGVPGAAAPGDSDDTMLYVGLGVAAVAIIGGAIWWKKRRAK